ncbi:hypothetical protein Klosneuvirus_11_7 [Klosneuvirus KNV1]|uniref:Uncharacterized protein n=1 Tax=Klosneuvirus KNV1 TaxID=1977640 RepID=A0A1V0SLR4_9VIRU|nr:hypothetical protein Klosneuvirus_11_7 [Klosneuvirus KNV1]
MDRKEYLKKYYEEHKEQWNVKKICNICNGSYSYSSRYRHFNSKKHKLSEKDNKIKELEDKLKNIV